MRTTPLTAMLRISKMLREEDGLECKAYITSYNGRPEVFELYDDDMNLLFDVHLSTLIKFLAGESP